MARPAVPRPSRADRLVVIGASAGGVEALVRTVRPLPESFEAPIVVVLHMPATSRSRLPEILGRAGALPAVHVSDGIRMKPGTIYVAPPDRHVVVAGNHLRLVDGARENGVRPAIDPLFRSAARSHGTGAIGAVLSGTLDDGTAGLAAIHAMGGVTVAQDPNDAISPDMPRNAIENATIDHVVAADGLANLFVDLLRTDAAEREPAADSRSRSSRETDQVCPECGGVLREFVDNGVFRFHCRVGHDYSPETLYEAQDSKLEAALWAAIRSLEESASLAQRLAASARSRGAEAAAIRFDERQRRAAERANTVRGAILTLSALEDTPGLAEAQPVAREDDERWAEAARGTGTRASRQ